MEPPTNTQSIYYGTEEEDPTNPSWAHGNYVGPNWSNGKNQESVEWGDLHPSDEFDNLARQHDAAYAHWKDRAHREAADMIFAEQAGMLDRKYGTNFASNPKVAGAAVQYGNYTKRQAIQLASDVAKYGLFGGLPLGLIKFTATNIYNANKMIKGTYLQKEKERVKNFYAAAPEPTRYNSRGVSTAGKQVDVSGNPRGDTPAVVQGKQPAEKAKTVRVQPVPDSNPGPSSNLLWPSKQVKRFADYNALREAAQKQYIPVYKKTPLNLNIAKPEKYRRKKKKNAIRPL